MQCHILVLQYSVIVVQAEEAKRAQQAEVAAKMKEEADRYKVGRRNVEANVDKPGNIIINSTTTIFQIKYVAEI